MSLRLIDRMTRLVRADAHGVVESLEERGLLIKQYVREAELELRQKRARLDALTEEGKRLADELAKREDEIRSLDEDVELALAGDKEELARFAVRRLLPLRGLERNLRSQIAQVEESRTELEGSVAEKHTRLEQLKTRARAELSRLENEREGDALFADPTVADEEIDLELMRRRARGSEGAA